MLTNADDVLRRIYWGGTWAHDTEQERGLVKDIERVAIDLARTTVLSFDQAVRGLWVLADAGMTPDGAAVVLQAGVPAALLADALREHSRRV